MVHPAQPALRAFLVHAQHPACSAFCGDRPPPPASCRCSHAINRARNETVSKRPDSPGPSRARESRGQREGFPGMFPLHSSHLGLPVPGVMLVTGSQDQQDRPSACPTGAYSLVWGRDKASKQAHILSATAIWERLGSPGKASRRR